MILASDDAKLTPDEVADVVGAPRNGILAELLHGFALRDVEKGLTALQSAHTAHVDIKLLYRLLLERVRAVIITRNLTVRAADVLQVFSEDDQTMLRTYAEDTTSSINSRLLQRLLAAGDLIGKSAIPELPLELVLIEHCAG